MAPASANRPRLAQRRRHPADRRHQRAERKGADELRRCQHDVRRRAQRTGDQHQKCKRGRARQRDQRPASSRLATEGRKRDQHSAKADTTHRAPAPPADFFTQQNPRQCGDDDRTRHVVGDDVGERQIDGGDEERRDPRWSTASPGASCSHGRSRSAKAARCRQIIGSSSRSAGAGAQPEQLPDRVGPPP